MSQLTLVSPSHGVQGSTFADEVRAIPGGEHLEMCYSCGTCVSKCLIQQKVDPEYNPRRLLRMIMLGLREESFRSPTTWLCSACDLCAPACPQKIHISQVIAAVKQLAVEAGHQSPLEAVAVDESLCSGCGICVASCPYEAPGLVEKEFDGKMDRLAVVDANKCMGCGVCVAACPLGAIARPGVGNAEVMARMEMAETSDVPRLVTFVCDWCLRADGDLTLLESYPPSVRVIHIPCSGRIEPQMALMALRSGIDGVLVCGCAPGECHYKRGTDISACKIGLLGRMLDEMNSSTGRVSAGGRVRFAQIGTQDRGRVRTEVDSMLDYLAARREAKR